MGIISFIKEEIDVIRDRDPAIKKTSEVFFIPKLSCNTSVSHCTLVFQ